MTRLAEAPERIIVYDTSLRDGNQALESRLTVEGKLKLAVALDEWGVDCIEGGWPESNPTDEEFFREAKGLPLRHARLVAFGRTRKSWVRPENDDVLQNLLQTETRTLAIFGKSSVEQVRYGLRTTLQENLDMIHDSVSFLRQDGRAVIYDAEHLFDGYKQNPQYAMRTLEAAIYAGAQEVVLCDTNGINEPEFIARVTRKISRRFSNIPIGIHAHNDRDFATYNTIAAVRAGAVHIQGVVNGNGERAGNADLVIVLKNLYDLYGIQSGVNLMQSYSISQVVADETEIPVPPNHPITGENVFTHNAGTHAALFLRRKSLYGGIEPESVGREASIGFSDQGGSTSILAMGEKFGFRLSPNDPEFGLIMQRMKAKRVFGDAQVYLLFYEALVRGVDPFEVLDQGSEVVDRRDASPKAAIRVRVNGDTHAEIAEGSGLIHAFDRALRGALSYKYPEVNDIKLIPGSYRVNEPRRESDTSAEVEVFLKLTANGQVWSSRVRGTDQQRAGEDAITEGYKYFILRNRPV